MVGTQRVPYWQGGRAYQPYAAGYFGGFGPMDWMFMGFAVRMMGDGLGDRPRASATASATWPAGSATASATSAAASATSSTASTSDMRRAGARGALLLTLLAVLAGFAAPSYAGGAVTLPPTGTDWDYQLGGARPVPAHVGIVERDRLASPVAGKYNVCYVNGFQTQVEQKRFWHRHWSLVLKDHGKPVVDSVWGEWLLDTRTPAKRTALAAIMGRWTDRCARGRLRRRRVRQPRLVQPQPPPAHPRRRQEVRRAARRRARTAPASRPPRRTGPSGTAGASASTSRSPSSAAQYRECGSYVDHYGDHVLAVEYHAKAFRRTCAHWSDRIAVVRRDVDLTRHGVRRWC